MWYGGNDYPDSAGIWIWHLTNGVANQSDITVTQVISVRGTLTMVFVGYASAKAVPNRRLALRLRRSLTPGPTNCPIPVPT